MTPPAWPGCMGVGRHPLAQPEILLDPDTVSGCSDRNPQIGELAERHLWGARGSLCLPCGLVLDARQCWLSQAQGEKGA